MLVNAVRDIVVRLSEFDLLGLQIFGGDDRNNDFPPEHSA